MSMTNTGTRPEAFAAARYWGPGYSRISWGAVLAGAVVAVATTLLLSLLGAALGTPTVRPLETTSADLASYGTAAAIWQIINYALSMAFGGYVAARLSGTHSHLDGELHGITMWALALLLGSVLLAQTLGSVASIVGRGAGSIVNRAVGELGTTAGTAAPEIDTRALANRMEQSLAGSGDPTTMSHEQIGAEISALLSRNANGSLSETDHNRLISLVGARSGVTREEAIRRVTQMESDAKAFVAQAEQKARTVADGLVHDAGTAARALFTALVLGLLGALVGAWIGTRHKRALHPVVEHGVDTHTPAYAPRTVHERVAPMSVSVFDDSDHLMAQYLRDAAFPVSKNELLRLARSSNGGSSLMHSIEAMPEGSYANANEVLRTLGMLH